MKSSTLRYAMLSLPLAVLVAWTGYHTISSRIGTEIILKVAGYDPRDLLSGHYLTYNVVYEPAVDGCGAEGSRERNAESRSDAYSSGM